MALDHVQGVLDHYADAWHRRDAKALASVYASSAVAFRSNGEPMRGPAEIEERWDGPLAR